MEKNKFTALMISGIMALALCSCTARPADTPVDSSAQTAQESAEGTDEGTDSTGNNAADSAAAGEVSAQLDDIAAVEVGTAGSSLKSAAAASRLLDWAAETTLSADEISSAAAAWRDGIDGDAADMLEGQVQSVLNSIDTITAADGQSLLETAGVTDSSYPWDSNAVEVARTLLNAVL